MSSLLPQSRRLLLRSSGIIPSQCQAFSSTPHTRARRGGGYRGDVEVDRYGEPLVDEEDASTSATYENWLASTGRKYMHPNPLGPKWLGDDVPFPLNPTFRPSPPLSDAVHSAIYQSWVKTHDGPGLSATYGVSIKRIEAIVKLKSLEVKWIEKKPLQTGFRAGMENILGVQQGGNRFSIAQEMISPSRGDAKEIDEMVGSADGENRGKRGLSRTYFEPVDENEEPVVSKLLEQPRAEATPEKKPEKKKEYPTNVVQPNPARPGYMFVDVGLRWFNPKDAQKRTKESERRKEVKARKAQKLAIKRNKAP